MRRLLVILTIIAFGITLAEARPRHKNNRKSWQKSRAYKTKRANKRLKLRALSVSSDDFQAQRAWQMGNQFGVDQIQENTDNDVPHINVDLHADESLAKSKKK